MKKFFENMKKLLENPDRKKLVENCIIVIIIGTIIIIAGGSLFGGKKKEKEPVSEGTKSVETVGRAISTEEKAELEKKIENILSQIDGAGKVSVAITFFSGKEVVPAYDTKKTENGTDEKDSTGGTRNIKQNEVENKIVYEESTGGIKKPIIIKELQPAVKGVVVVADGAGDVQVKDNLCRAAQVLLDVPIHRIQVFQKGK